MTTKSTTQQGLAAFFEQQWKIPLFFQFLQISPSYRMAHESFAKAQPLPDQYDAVRLEENYKRFGDVWSLTLNEWWLEHGRHWLGSNMDMRPRVCGELSNMSLNNAQEMDLHHIRLINGLYEQVFEFVGSQYATDGYPDVTFIAVPLSGDLEDTQHQTHRLIADEFKKRSATGNTQALVSFQRNKIRRITLERCIFAVHQKAKLNPKLFDLGQMIAEHFGQSRLVEETQDPRSLESQTSELLKKALNMAEWAAVGEFPKLGPRERRRKATAEFKHGKVETMAARYHIKFDWEFLKSETNIGRL